ncbi:MAG: flagellar basal body-associated FliL family protein [Paracoccaceae bacterium]
MKKLLPIILALIGLGGGVFAGKLLRPPPVEIVELQPCGDVGMDPTMAAKEQKSAPADPMGAEQEGFDYVKLNNQFIVPDVEEGRVAAMVVLSLSLEVGPGGREIVYQREPKLRDAFLQVLFDHANAGGFRGSFTDSSNMSLLRDALREIAQKTLGEQVSDVLIIDIVRQDVS